MPENESVITYLECKKLITATGNKRDLQRLENAISTDYAGMIFLYAGNKGKFEIKRYRNGRFIKKSW